MKKTPWHQRIVTQAMSLQLAVVAVVLLVVSAAFARVGESALREQYGLRAQMVAESVAEAPEVRSAIASGQIQPEVQIFAEGVRRRTNVSFVVVADASGVRHSHPKPERIGQVVSTDPGPALVGISDWYVQTGTLGESVRGKVPVWDPTGEEVVGIVSVGVLTGEVSETVRDGLAGILLVAGLAFAAGAVAAYFAARRIRSQMLGLEPPEIAALYEHRDGLLQALHEGVLAIDRDGVVTLLNGHAGRLLAIRPEAVGEQLTGRLDLQPLLDLAQADAPLVDVPLQIGNETLLVTTAPVIIRGRSEGAVFTVRDRTELRALVSELESAQGLIDALRAQAHEHANNLHTISGLIELDRHSDVRSILEDHSIAQRHLTDLFSERTGGDSLIIASLLAKAAIAAERNIAIRTHLGDLPHVEVGVMRDLVTVVGNLVDNAIDHLSEQEIGQGEIEIAMWTDDAVLNIEVSDSGEGMDREILDNVFARGFTTKDPVSHDGLGLAIVSQLVQKYDGQVNVDSELGSGTLFSIQMHVQAESEFAGVS